MKNLNLKFSFYRGLGRILMNDQYKTKEQLIKELIELRLKKFELEKSEAERKDLEKMYKRYEIIANTSKELMTLINKNYVYEAVNESYAKAHKSIQEAIIGKTVADIWGEKVFNTIIKKYLDACLQGNEVHYQEKFRFPGLEQHCFNVAYYPYYSEKGKVTHAVVFTHYISEKETKKEGQEREKLMKSIIYNANVWINVTDENGNIVVWNKEAENISGYSSEEVIGNNKIWEWIYPDEKYRNEINAKLKKRQVLRNFETTISRKDDEMRIISWNLGNLVDNKNNYIGSIAIGTDITDYERMKEEFQKIEKLESIGILAGGIAHDFNNLLTGVLGNIALAKLYLKEDKLEETLERLEEAEKVSLSSKNLTQRLLTFSKGGSPIKEFTDISALLKEAVEFALSGSNVKPQFTISDNLWMVEIDKEQIKQVINNLIINSDQAMPNGGIVEIKAENVIINEEDDLPLKEGKYVKISIDDNGIGIAKENLSKIFDPYFTTKQMGTQKGTGLGLAICHSIIKNHDGYITVESQVGVGTTFYIYLPSCLSNNEEVKKDTNENKGKILVMDDEKIVRDIAGLILEQLGYKTDFAEHGDKAVKIYKDAKESAEPYDAVILDLTVPGGMGAKETLKKLLEIDPQVKAIISSGYSNDSIMADYKQHGFVGAIAKPYKIKELSDLLCKVIG